MPDTPADAPWLRHLRAEVRARLKARHVTQDSLAAYLGITPHHLNQVLTGKVVGSPDLLTRMAEAMGMRIAIVSADREPAWLAADRRLRKRGRAAAPERSS